MEQKNKNEKDKNINPKENSQSDEVLAVASKILKKHKRAFEVLGQ